jgi:hypothetical protein
VNKYKDKKGNQRFQKGYKPQYGKNSEKSPSRGSDKERTPGKQFKDKNVEFRDSLKYNMVKCDYKEFCSK